MKATSSVTKYSRIVSPSLLCGLLLILETLCGCHSTAIVSKAIDLEMFRTPRDSVYSYVNDSTLMPGFQLGELALEGLFSQVCISEGGRHIKIEGQVVLAESGEPVSGAIVSIGTIGLRGDRRPIEARHKVKADRTGAFAIEGDLLPDQVLVLSAWTYVAAVYRIGNLVKPSSRTLPAN